MQAQLVNLMNGLLKHGNEIHLVLYHPGDDKGFFCDALNVPSNNIVRLGASGGFKFLVPKYICSESRHHDVILSFLHSANFYVTCAKVLNLVVRKKRKFYNIAVDMSSFGNRRTWRLAVMSFVSMLFANRVVSNSDTQHSYYRNLPGGEQKSVFIPNGVDDKRFFVPCEDWQQEERGTQERGTQEGVKCRGRAVGSKRLLPHDLRGWSWLGHQLSRGKYTNLENCHAFFVLLCSM